MPHDPLETLLHVRRRAVDDSRQSLARCLSAASLAAAAVRLAEHAIVEETQRASDPSGGDNLVEAFARWLPGARQRVAQAVANLDWQEAEAARCRADLTACRAALESLVQLRDTRRDQAEAERLRLQQLQLDECVRRPDMD